MTNLRRAVSEITGGTSHVSFIPHVFKIIGLVFLLLMFSFVPSQITLKLNPNATREVAEPLSLCSSEWD